MEKSSDSIILRGNKKITLSRLFLILIFLTVLTFVIIGGIINNALPIFLSVLLILLLTYLCVVIIASCFGVVKVEIDRPNDQIIFYKVFSKRVIELNTINGYFKSFYNSAYKTTGYGIIIQTVDGKLFELNPGNLKDIDLMSNYLSDLSINFLGEKRSYYPFSSGL